MDTFAGNCRQQQHQRAVRAYIFFVLEFRLVYPLSAAQHQRYATSRNADQFYFHEETSGENILNWRTDVNFEIGNSHLFFRKAMAPMNSSRNRFTIRCRRQSAMLLWNRRKYGGLG